MAQRYRVALIGTGARSCSYAKPYLQQDDLEIVAIADPSAQHRATMMHRVGLTGIVAQHDDWRELLTAGHELDGVVITSPNQTHPEPAVACFERGLPIALEKPLAHTKEACERIIDAERANSGRSLLGFVLRSAPFHSTIHRLLSDGAIGRLVSIQADELVGWGVTSIMNRSPWRRYQHHSGGSMLEKCCHDIDILNWMIGARPVALASFGGRRIFHPNPTLPETCDGCGVADRCKYYKQPKLASQEDVAESNFHEFLRSEDARCIYNIDSDVADVQSVAIEYDDGVVATFLMNFHCAGPKAGRNFHAVGLNGRIWGNMHEHKVYVYDNLSGQTTEHDTSGDGSGHGGGDQRHALLLRQMMAEPEFRPEQNATAGYRSAVVCFATDLSRWEQRRVDLRYEESGHIALV